jgi:stringent starvation protein B
MKTETHAVNDQSVTRPISADAEIEGIARETDMPVELVQAIYARERAKLERTARIKTYVPVLVHRHVKALLRE